MCYDSVTPCDDFVSLGPEELPESAARAGHVTESSHGDTLS